jgi:sugar phosphate isomerase/epimerase
MRAIRAYKLGLSDVALADRLLRQAEWLEYHLYDHDLEERSHREQLEGQLVQLRDKGIQAVLHMPLGKPGARYGMLAPHPQLIDRFYIHAEQLAELCEKHGVPIVFHPMTGMYDELAKMPMPEQHAQLIRAMETFDRRIGLCERFYFENVLEGPCSFKNPELPEVFRKTGAKMVLDTSHALISMKGDNQKVLELWDRLDEHIAYFHLVDSMGMNHDALILFDGIGEIAEWMKRIGDRPYVLEIKLHDPDFAIEMEESYFRLKRALEWGFEHVKHIYQKNAIEKIRF